MIKQYKLESYIDLVISADDVSNIKPHPEAVLKATDTLKINPEEVIVVGDSKKDILMGQNAGSKTVLFAPKEYNLYYNLAEIKKTNPTYIIDRISQLKKIIY